MRMARIVVCVLFLLPLLSFEPPAGHAQTPQEVLAQYIADLQKNPGDSSLREKIIKHVLGMKPKPKVPDEVTIREGAAEYAFKNAKTEGDFGDSAKEYEKALLAAPWYAADYFNCGVAYEKAKKYDAAVQNFTWYLMADPSAQDANDVRKRIGGLQFAAKKAASAPAPVQVQNPLDILLRKIEGRRYICHLGNGVTGVFDVRGRILVWGTIDERGYQEWTGEAARVEIKGLQTSVPLYMHLDFQTVWANEDTFILSEDGEMITVRVRFTDGDTRAYTYLWQR